MIQCDEEIIGSFYYRELQKLNYNIIKTKF